MKLSSKQYELLSSLLAQAKDRRDIEAIASRFNDDSLLVMLAGLADIREAIEMTLAYSINKPSEIIRR